MIKPLVSIQIPTYNQKQYIKESLDSALAQSYENLQIIVSDDCSPNYDIFDYLKEYKDNPKVVIIRNPQNVGRVANYHNTLYNFVQGEWFLNLDGDDYLTDRNFIKNAINVLLDNVNENPLMYQGDHNLDVLKNKFENFRKIDVVTASFDSQDFLMNWYKVNNFRHSSTLFHTTSAKNSGFYNFDCIFSDFNAAAKLWSIKGSVILSSRNCSHWRQHGENDTFSLNLNSVENELASIDDIISAASTRMPSNKMLAFKRFKYSHIITHTVLSFHRNRNWRKEIAFFLKHFMFTFPYFKLITRYCTGTLK